MTASTALGDIYVRLLKAYGPQHWWPADDPFEVMVGAILTQSTAWANVEKAIRSLKAANALAPPALRGLRLDELAALVRPSGYYMVKARKLKALADWYQRHNDDLVRLASEGTWQIRKELLAVYGIGEETADSILLYAIGKPVFVIDAYTRRTIDRIGSFAGGLSALPRKGMPYRAYDDYQRLFMDNLRADVALFNEYHALFVAHGKKTCRKAPLCGGCSLTEVCDYGRSLVASGPELRRVP
jgi:endonuclease-3 related protein